MLDRAKAVLVLLLLVGSGVTVRGHASFAQGSLYSVEQIQLSEKHVIGFIGAWPKLEKLQADLLISAQPQKVAAEIQSVLRSAGFAGINEFRGVQENIVFIVAGFDGDTYRNPHEEAEKLIDEDLARKTLSESEKAALRKDMLKSIERAPRLQYQGNLKLVRKYLPQLLAVTR